MDERIYFHPFVAGWLKTNEYTYQYEVKMPEYGRADFVAQHADGHTLVIECKVDESAKDGRSIIQLLDYHRQIRTDKVAYAVPSSMVTETIEKLCERYNVWLIRIEAPTNVVLDSPPKRVMRISKRRARDHERELIRNQIKATARQQMDTQGIAGLSLRAIAREMDITAPAIYNYYNNLEDLVMALAIDASNALADAMKASYECRPENDYFGQMLAILLVYREWSLTHVPDFRLIYNNPIVKLEISNRITAPESNRVLHIFMNILANAWADGQLLPPDHYRDVPDEIADQIQKTFVEQAGFKVPIFVILLAITIWTRVYGFVSLELSRYLHIVAKSADLTYHAQINHLLDEIGLQV